MYIIIGGGGDVGYYLTKSLLNQGHEVLLLEKGLARFQALNDELGQAVVRGDACEARTMEEVGASRADVVIAVTGEDEDNLVICQVAKKRFKVGRTIARVNNPKHAEIFQKLGIDITVSPTRSILSLIEAELPNFRFVQLMTLKNAGLEIVELRVRQSEKAPQCRIARRSLQCLIELFPGLSKSPGLEVVPRLTRQYLYRRSSLRESREQEQRRQHHWMPLPSTTVTYLSMGRPVKRSTRVLGFGQRTSSQSSFSALPMPSTSRGSWLERKLPPAVFSLARTEPFTLQRIREPVAAGFAFVPTRLMPIQWLLLSALS